MKEIEVATINQEKEIVKSSVIKIDENADRIKVIVSVGEDFYGKPISIANMGMFHKLICQSIENGSKVITIPSFVKINTIKV